jgi:hypothetical protein
VETEVALTMDPLPGKPPHASRLRESPHNM